MDERHHDVGPRALTTVVEQLGHPAHARDAQRCQLAVQTPLLMGAAQGDELDRHFTNAQAVTGGEDHAMRSAADLPQQLVAPCYDLAERRQPALRSWRTRVGLGRGGPAGGSLREQVGPALQVAAGSCQPPRKIPRRIVDVRCLEDRTPLVR
ncbi:MAG: hypothetical protein R3F05_15250, partial [Planctomycetota bacterium]